MSAPDSVVGTALAALVSGIANVGQVWPFLFLVAASPETLKLVKGA